ncbi:MAG: cupin domain-containing protein [Armatimonadetes bacterium]|nr:cupin domain-containing protein [Armatimonadota bacterium]
MNEMLLKSKYVKAEEGETVMVVGTPVRFILESKDSGGQISIWENRVPVGMGVPPHTHAHDDEIFFVQRGSFEVQVGEATYLANPGDLVFMPRNVPHSYRNAGDIEAVILAMATPAGKEEFFREFSRVDLSAGMDEAVEVAGRHGIAFV